MEIMKEIRMNLRFLNLILLTEVMKLDIHLRVFQGSFKLL